MFLSPGPRPPMRHSSVAEAPLSQPLHRHPPTHTPATELNYEQTLSPSRPIRSARPFEPCGLIVRTGTTQAPLMLHSLPLSTMSHPRPSIKKTPDVPWTGQRRPRAANRTPNLVGPVFLLRKTANDSLLGVEFFLIQDRPPLTRVSDRGRRLHGRGKAARPGRRHHHWPPTVLAAQGCVRSSGILFVLRSLE